MARCASSASTLAILWILLLMVRQPHEFRDPLADGPQLPDDLVRREHGDLAFHGVPPR
jgi:hypothetical protein